MFFLFLIPLAVTLGSGYAFKTARDTSTEAATVAFAVGLLGLTLTIILAPWEIQLLLLFLLAANVKWVALLNFLFSHNEFSRNEFSRNEFSRNESIPAVSEVSGDGKTKDGKTRDSRTSDRAANGDSVSVVTSEAIATPDSAKATPSSAGTAPSTEAVLTGRYRGAVCKLNQNPELPIQHLGVELHYRGAKIR